MRTAKKAMLNMRFLFAIMRLFLILSARRRYDASRTTRKNYYQRETINNSFVQKARASLLLDRFFLLVSVYLASMVMHLVFSGAHDKLVVFQKVYIFRAIYEA
jgi:hypothetical protein